MAATYTVQSGDNLTNIAASEGVTLQALEAANPQITNPDLINVGDVINIPGGSAASPAGAAILTQGADTNPGGIPDLWYYIAAGACALGAIFVMKKKKKKR